MSMKNNRNGYAGSKDLLIKVSLNLLQWYRTDDMAIQAAYLEYL